MMALIMIGVVVLAHAYNTPRGNYGAFQFCLWVCIACALYCAWREIRTWYYLTLFISATAFTVLYLISVFDSIRLEIAIKNGTAHELMSFELYLIPLIITSVGGLIAGTVGCLKKQFSHSK